MEKEFIPYQQALELKELGFDEPCFGKYDGKGNNKGKIWFEMPNRGQDTIPVGDVLAPTFSQAFRWFREKHRYYITIDYSHFKKLWIYLILNMDNEPPSKLTYADTYEEAELACLIKLIEIVKTK